jgi:TrmH family RNA methyltransferase
LGVSEPVGRHHPLVRRLRGLRRDVRRRELEGVFVAEGIHLVSEALAARAPVELVAFSPRLLRKTEGNALLREVEGRGLPCMEAADSVLDSVQDARSPQPVLAVVGRTRWPLDVGLSGGDPASWVVVAFGLQDPGNLGALVRTTDGAGAAACYVCGESVDPYHPRAVRATMGSIFRVPTPRVELSELLRLLRDRGVRTIGTSPCADISYLECDLSRPVALFFGREGSGLPEELAARLDERVHIPLRTGVESLSVGAAAAVLLFEAARQRALNPRS